MCRGLAFFTYRRLAFLHDAVAEVAGRFLAMKTQFFWALAHIQQLIQGSILMQNHIQYTIYTTYVTMMRLGFLHVSADLKSVASLADEEVQTIANRLNKHSYIYIYAYRCVQMPTAQERKLQVQFVVLFFPTPIAQYLYIPTVPTSPSVTRWDLKACQLSLAGKTNAKHRKLLKCSLKDLKRSQ